jgi:hypothetical protein
MRWLAKPCQTGSLHLARLKAPRSEFAKSIRREKFDHVEQTTQRNTSTTFAHPVFVVQVSCKRPQLSIRTKVKARMATSNVFVLIMSSTCVRGDMPYVV